MSCSDNQNDSDSKSDTKNIESDKSAETDADSDSDTDSDADSDSDIDSDTDADTDSDTDSDTDVDGDSDDEKAIETDSGEETAPDAGADTEVPEDTATEPDTFPELEPGPNGLFLNNNVAIIGDSIFDLSDAIRRYLEQLSGERYRYYPKSGAQMVGGALVTPIPQQYAQGKKDGPLRTIIMDGGGNDVLIGGQLVCRRNYSAACASIIEETKQAGIKLSEQFVADGVQNVIWLGYYYTNGLIAGAPGQKVALDKGMEITKEECETREDANCYFVDPRPEFTGKSGLINSDGIHPTDAGAKIIADLIWQTMQENNVEQNEH